MSRRSESSLELDPLTLAAATWLACGIVLLGLTPLPLRDPTTGWSPAFWLLAAPAVLLLARRFFAPSRSKRLPRKVRPRKAVPEFNGSGRLRPHHRQATRRSGNIKPTRRSASLPSA